jgi:hypothetical protein
VGDECVGVKGNVTGGGMKGGGDEDGERVDENGRRISWGENN